MDTKEYVESRLVHFESMLDEEFNDDLAIGAVGEVRNMVLRIGLKEFDERSAVQIRRVFGIKYGLKFAQNLVFIEGNLNGN